MQPTTSSVIPRHIANGNTFKEVVRGVGLVDYWRAYGWSDFCKPLAGGDDFECR